MTPDTIDLYSIFKEPTYVIGTLKNLRVSTTREKITDTIDSLQVDPRPANHKSLQVRVSPPILRLPVKQTKWYIEYQVYDTQKRIDILSVGRF